jgi:hypothetical protein
MENWTWKDDLLELDPCMEFADESFDEAIEGYVERFGCFITPSYNKVKVKEIETSTGKKFKHPFLAKMINHENHDTLREAYGEEHPELILFDDLDEAVFGTVTIKDKPVVLYDREKVLELYMERDGMDYSEAYENYTYNTIGGWYGDYTPAFLVRDESA